MKKNKNKAFTLVEILVAMAIVAILAGVVLVSLQAQREHAFRNAVESGLESYLPYVVDCYNSGKLTYDDCVPCKNKEAPGCDGIDCSNAANKTDPRCIGGCNNFVPGDPIDKCPGSPPVMPKLNYPFCPGDNLQYYVYDPAGGGTSEYAYAMTAHCWTAPSEEKYNLARCYYGGDNFGKCEALFKP